MIAYGLRELINESHTTVFTLAASCGKVIKPHELSHIRAMWYHEGITELLVPS
jgi:hypothetical protein